MGAPKNSRSDPADRAKPREILALVCIGIVAFVLLSIVSYDEADIPAVQMPANDPVRNAGGIAGAHVAYFLLRNLGVASYVFVALLAFWAFQALFRKNLRGLTPKLGGAGIATLACATAASVSSIVSPQDFGLAGTSPSAGGIYGEAMRALMMERIGPAGTYIALLLALAISLTLATDWLLLAAVLAAGRGAWRVARASAPLWRAIARWGSAEALRRRAHEAVEEAVMEARARPSPVETAREVIERAGRSQPAPEPAAPRARSTAPPTPYRPPPIETFDPPPEQNVSVSARHIRACTEVIEQTLRNFHVDAKVIGHTVGPSVTTYELELGAGIKQSRVITLSNDIATHLGVPRVRIVAPLPGKTTVGIEVPNPLPEIVRIREFLGAGYDELRKTPLTVLLGKSVGGDPIIRSLTEMPHLLVAGTTGFGKSVCLKAIIASIVSTMSPDELKLVLVDPKMVEMTLFRDIPHLWAPVITDSQKAAQVLDWLVKEMEDRYHTFEQLQVSKIETYNRLGARGIARRLEQAGAAPGEAERFPQRMPYIVVVVDELADLMMTSRKEVETSIIRLSQKSRAVGIHLVVATQRPSADIVTGLIRSNMPARISFRVASSIESRIILDQAGAEGLVAKGEMLMILPGQLQPVRAQCTFVSDGEVKRLCEYLRGLGEPEYHAELLELNSVATAEGTVDDPLFDEAVRVVLEHRLGSTSLVQRRLQIGYGRASRLIEAMEAQGIVGPHNGAKPRDVLITLEQWEARRSRPPA